MLFYISSNRSVLALKYSIPLCFIKIAFGIGIGIYYFYIKNGSGDSFQFFKMALGILEKPSSEIYEFFIYSKSDLQIDTIRSVLFLKFLIPIVWISLKNYWLSSFLISSISFLTLFAIFKRYVGYLAKFKPQLIFSFFVFPSVLFWTSGIFKESMALIFLLLSLIAVFDFSIRRKINFFSITVSLLSFYIFFQLRYFLAVFMIPVISILISRELSKKKAQLFIAFSISILGIIVIIHPVLNPFGFPDFLYAAHHGILLQKATAINLYYNFNDPSWLSIIKNLPVAFLNAFIRPFPWEWGTIQSFIYSLDNYILITAIITYAYKFKSQKNKAVMLMALIIICAIILLSLATPNLGSLYRYKSLCIPFLMFLIIKDLNIRTFHKLKAN